MSLQDRLNQKKEQSAPQTIGSSSRETHLENELSEVKKQNSLLKERMIEIEKSQEGRNERIDNLLGKLEKGTTDWNYKVHEATEKVSEQLLNTQRRNFEELEKSFKNQNKLSQKFHKIQGYSYFALSIIAMVLLIALIARTLAIGVWEGLFLSQLWNLEGWYWSALTVVILVGLVGGLVVLIIKGFEEMRF
nr:hypothetical protein [Salinicoccus albus]